MGRPAITDLPPLRRRPLSTTLDHGHHAPPPPPTRWPYPICRCLLSIPALFAAGSGLGAARNQKQRRGEAHGLKLEQRRSGHGSTRTLLSFGRRGVPGHAKVLLASRELQAVRTGWRRVDRKILIHHRQRGTNARDWARGPVPAAQGRENTSVPALSRSSTPDRAAQAPRRTGAFSWDALLCMYNILYGSLHWHRAR
jgi:hypothetical protein